MPPISTVNPPGGRIGPPTCGTRTVTCGHTCMSPTLAAGCPILSCLPQFDPPRHVHTLGDKAPELLGSFFWLAAHRREVHRAGNSLRGQVIARRHNRSF